jgi:hypothetical protein
MSKKPLAIDLFCGFKEVSFLIPVLGQNIHCDRAAHDMSDIESKTCDVELSPAFSTLHFVRILAYVRCQELVIRYNFRNLSEDREIFAAAIQQRLYLCVNAGPCVCDGATFSYYNQNCADEIQLLIFARQFLSKQKSNISDLCSVA